MIRRFVTPIEWLILINLHEPGSYPISPSAAVEVWKGRCCGALHPDSNDIKDPLVKNK